MMVGVNGAGKTTSIGKLAKYFKDQQKRYYSVLPIRSEQQPTNNWLSGQR